MNPKTPLLLPEHLSLLLDIVKANGAPPFCFWPCPKSTSPSHTRFLAFCPGPSSLGFGGRNGGEEIKSPDLWHN
jgi:hypothetical protein